MLPLILLALVTLLCLWSSRKPKQFPPGPPKLPLVGSLPFMAPSIFHGVRHMVSKYGKISGFFLGNEPCVVISDYEILKDLLKMDETAGRPPTRPFNEGRWGHDYPGLDGRSLGLVLSQGKVWKEQRPFVMRHLRDFGFGKSSMEDMLHAEIEKLIHLLEKKRDKAIELDCLLNISVVNALWTMLVGEKLELEDPRLNAVVVAINHLVKETTPMSPLALVLPSPSMIKLPVLRNVSGFSHMKSTFKTMHDMFSVVIKSHEAELQEGNGGEHRDLLDVLLSHVRSTTDPGSSFHPSIGVASIGNILLDLFIAGMETTSSTLVWTFLYLLHHPDMQEKVYQEIVKVVGTERMPSLSDQDDMPYTNAVLHESFRFTGFVHLSAPHYTTKEIIVQGFVIPANTTLFPNLYHIMNDEDYWKDPREFNPERFIDPQGRFKKDERVIPFSVGKRFCLGQSLAEKELFLFFTALVQRFRMRHVSGARLPSLDVNSTNPTGPLRSAPKYEVVLEIRKDN